MKVRTLQDVVLLFHVADCPRSVVTRVPVDREKLSKAAFPRYLRHLRDDPNALINHPLPVVVPIVTTHPEHLRKGLERLLKELPRGSRVGIGLQAPLAEEAPALDPLDFMIRSLVKEFGHSVVPVERSLTRFSAKERVVWRRKQRMSQEINESASSSPALRRLLAETVQRETSTFDGGARHSLRAPGICREILRCEWAPDDVVLLPAGTALRVARELGMVPSRVVGIFGRQRDVVDELYACDRRESRALKRIEISRAIRKLYRRSLRSFTGLFF